MDPESSSGQTPGSRRQDAALHEETGKAGCRRLDVGGRCLKNGAKQAEGGLVDFDKNGVSYVPLPTSHILIYPTSRRSLELRRKIMLPPLGEGRGGGCWRCKNRMPGASSWSSYTLRPTSHIPDKQPLSGGYAAISPKGGGFRVGHQTKTACSLCFKLTLPARAGS